jgi:putative hydrolase
VDWVREHFLGLVTALVSETAPDPKRVRVLLQKVIDARRSGAPLIDDRGLLGLFASRRQRETLDRIQATMCVLEGHGHVVMDRVGDRILRTRPRMASVVKTRRADPRVAAFFRLTGLEMKIKQYEMGERFVLGVEKAAGWAALDAVWSEPAALPSMAEIENPESWLRRVA